LSFYNTISECDVSSNFLDGLILDDSFDNIISNCIIWNHILSGISLKEGSLNNTIIDCCIQQNWRGVEIDSESTSNKITGCYITNSYWGIKLANSSLNMIKKCTIMDNVAGIMRGINNTVQSNNFINNKIYHAFGEQEHKNVWNRNYWSGHQSPLPCYLYGFNVDWFPKATPYDYPMPCDIPENLPDNMWDLDDIALLERNEKIDNLNNLRDRDPNGLLSLLSDERDILNGLISRLHSLFDEDKYAVFNRLEARAHMLNLKEEIR